MSYTPWNRICHQMRCRAACLLPARHPDLDIRDGAQLYASLLAALPLPRLAQTLAAPAKPSAHNPASEDRGSPHPAAAPAQATAADAREGRGWVHTRVGAELGMRLSLEHAPSALRPPPAPPAASGERELLERIAGPARLGSKPSGGLAADDMPRPQARGVSLAADPAGALAAGGSNPQSVPNFLAAGTPVQSSEMSPMECNGEALAADAGSAAAGGPAPDPDRNPAVCGRASAGTVLPQYRAHVSALDSPEITLWLQLGLHAEQPPEQLADAGSGERQAGAAGALGETATPEAGAAGAALFGVEVAFVSEAALRRALADPEILSECGLNGISGGSTIGSLPPCDAVLTGAGSDAARVAVQPQGLASVGRRKDFDKQGNEHAGSESPGEVFWDHAQRPRGAWASMGTVRVPHLTAQADPNPDPDQTPSCGRTIVPLRLAPVAALPDVLLPTARFTDAAGAHGAVKPAPLPLRLAHLLTPVPLPRSLAGRSAEVHLTRLPNATILSTQQLDGVGTIRN